MDFAKALDSYCTALLITIINSKFPPMVYDPVFKEEFSYE